MSSVTVPHLFGLRLVMLLLKRNSPFLKTMVRNSSFWKLSAHKNLDNLKIIHFGGFMQSDSLHKATHRFTQHRCLRVASEASTPHWGYTVTRVCSFESILSRANLAFYGVKRGCADIGVFLSIDSYRLHYDVYTGNCIPYTVPICVEYSKYTLYLHTSLLYAKNRGNMISKTAHFLTQPYSTLLNFHYSVSHHTQH